MHNSIPLFTIDHEFRRMIYPLSRRNYKQLERDILSNGCQVPISVWNGMIIDGHNRYEICQKYLIELKVKEVKYVDRDDALYWICINQLNRNDISEEMRRYLIGKRYIIEMSRESPDNNNITVKHKAFGDRIHASPLSCALDQEFHVSPYTISKYASLTRAVDNIAEFYPEEAKNLAYGKIRASMDVIVEISRKNVEEMGKFLTEVIHSKKKSTQKELAAAIAEKPATSIKDMPKYDPDSHVMSLALTIPSWIKTMNKAKDNTNMRRLSPKARVLLLNSLDELVRTSLGIINQLEGKQ